MSAASRVSVLIPCFNAAPYLAATLDSARRQTMRPLEIVVVDDGSTDGSQDIAAADARVTLLESPGKGASAARTHAARHAHGEFLQFLDADDLLAPTALETRVAALDATGADVAISDWQRLVQAGGGWTAGMVESGALPAPDDPADVQVMRGFWAPPAAVLYRRAVCERIGEWSPTLPVIQDARYLLDAARIGKGFVHVPGVGASYRQHERDSLSTRDTAHFWSDVLRNATEVERLWKRDRRMDAARRGAILEVYDNCARMGFVHDRRLFDASRFALERSGGGPSTPFVRAAFFLSRMIGFGAARMALKPFRR
jgi:Glycosyl transferase family 2